MFYICPRNEDDFLIGRIRMLFVYRDSYIMACPPVRGDSARALASTVSPAQMDKPQGKTVYNSTH